jgi:hypothetical protein
LSFSPLLSLFLLLLLLLLLLLVFWSMFFYSSLCCFLFSALTDTVLVKAHIETWVAQSVLWLPAVQQGFHSRPWHGFLARGSEASHASCSTGTNGPSPGLKAGGITNADIKNTWRYNSTSHTFSWYVFNVTGTILCFPCR